MHRTHPRHRHGRHRHMRGFGPGFGHGGPGGGRRQRGDVRFAALSLLGEKPMHGYEMIQQLEERTGGRWRPSAGSIYPTLQLLEDEGLVSSEQVDGKKVFTLTKDGEKAVAEAGDRTPPWEEEAEDSPRHQLRAEAFRLRGALMQVGQAGDEKQVAEALEVLRDTRKKLYGILGS